MVWQPDVNFGLNYSEISTALIGISITSSPPTRVVDCKRNIIDCFRDRIGHAIHTTKSLFTTAGGSVEDAGPSLGILKPNLNLHCQPSTRHESSIGSETDMSILQGSQTERKSIYHLQQ